MESEGRFDVSEKKTIMAKAYEGSEESKREICPDCVDHPQMNMTEVNRLSRELDTELDCKNLFLEDGKVIDQCCCYSIVHAIGYQELIEEPMTWFCESCLSKTCSKFQNEKPTKSDCELKQIPKWYAKRWLRYTTPNPDYENWLRYFGTEAEKILWEQEKKDRNEEMQELK